MSSVSHQLLSPLPILRKLFHEFLPLLQQLLQQDTAEHDYDHLTQLLVGKLILYSGTSQITKSIWTTVFF